MTSPRVLLIELNEVNFEFVRRYVAKGRLPTFGRLIAQHGVASTSSESRYEDLEPWIQWVTAHTGKDLAAHGVFRLGDIVASDHEQIWERLEAQGLSVGALSPMNAKNRVQRPGFFLPDPWTATEVAASPLVRRLHDAIGQAVNDNAQGRITPRSAMWLAIGLLRFARPSNYARYLRLAATAIGRPWRKAILFDLLMGDLFCALTRKARVDFGSAFFNAAAHIQHHYLLNSSVVEARSDNPDWYCPTGVDPVYEVYETYDHLLAQFGRQFPDYRIMIATGLSQQVHPEAVYYWRLKDHASFLDKIGIAPNRTTPRMSRDFVIEFDSAEAALVAEAKLLAVKGPGGISMFEVDNRGGDLFVTLSYPHDIPEDFVCMVGNESIAGFRRDIAFVAIKNGQHDGRGYFVDTAHAASSPPADFPLKGLPDKIVAAFAPAA